MDGRPPRPVKDAGALPLPEALAAAPDIDGGKWAIASRYGTQYVAELRYGRLAVWWRREFISPAWQDYDLTALPVMDWFPATVR